MGLFPSSHAVDEAEGIASDADAGGGELFKASRLFAPLSLNKTKKYAALVVVHGLCEEKPGALSLYEHDACDWTYMQYLSEHIAQDLGIVVLMIGMPDDDSKLFVDYPETATMKHKITSAMNNVWPAKYTSAALNAAIDHLIASAPDKLGVHVDPDRIGLMGHSLGGGGVLYAGAHDCRERVKAIVALNPSHFMVEKPFDYEDECVQFGKGVNFSGEFGEGEFPHLAQIVAPVLILGSQAEYNTTVPGEPASACWPTYECVFEQVGAAKKELYMDNITDQSWLTAHIWMVHDPGFKTYAEGMFYKIIANFCKRNLELEDAEESLERQSTTKTWTRVGADGGASGAAK